MAIREFTIGDLRRVLRAAAGDAEGVGLDVPFADLGYDSLALLETGGRIEREYGIELADSTITDAETPRALLASVNERLGATATA